MNNITDKLINEIEADLNTDSQGRTAARIYPKKEFQVPTAKPSKKASKADIARFVKLCVTHNLVALAIKKIEDAMLKLRVQLKERKARLSDLKSQIGEHLMDFGVTVRTEDKAFYAKPWKAQAEVKRNSSTMAEPLRAWAVGVIGMVEMLFLPDPDKGAMLNVTGLKRLLETDTRMNPALRTKLSGSLNALIKLAEAERLVQHPEDILDLEAYDKAKDGGLIPADIVAQVEEDAIYINNVSVDKITDFTHDRCLGCSDKLPKRREPGHKCKRCGTVV